MGSGVAIWWIMSICLSYPCFIYCMVNLGCAISFAGYRVGIMLIVISSIFITFIIIEYFRFVYPWYKENKYIDNEWILIIYTMIGIYIAINVAFNYISCMITHANTVNININIDDEYFNNMNFNDDELIKSFYTCDPDLLMVGNTTIRYCQKCKTYKPWRAYHCSKCNQCILRKDHHCPYVGRCVGFANFRYFYMFLTYLWLGTVYYIYMAHQIFIQLYIFKSCSITSLFLSCYVESKSSEENISFLLSYLLCCSICIVIGIYVTMFNHYLLTNQTQPEFSVGRMKMRKNPKLREIKHVYSLNTMIENVQQVFGKKWYLAFLPIPTYPLGNGKIYPLRKEVHQLVFDSNFNVSVTSKLLA